MINISFCSHFSGQWRSGLQNVACQSKCNIKLPCEIGHFCNRLTGDPQDFGKCIKAVTCPRSPFLSNGILTPDAAGILGSRAAFECPKDKKFSMSSNNAEILNTTSVNIKCTDTGWKLADGSNRDVPICIRSKYICN